MCSEPFCFGKTMLSSPPPLLPTCFANICCHCNWGEFEPFLNQTFLFLSTQLFHFKCFWCSSYSLIFGILSMDFATVVYLKALISSASPASHLQIVFSELRQQHRSVTQFWNILYVKLPLCFAQKLLLTVVAPLCFKSFFKGSTLYFYQRHEYLCRTLPVLSKRFFFPWAI